MQSFIRRSIDASRGSSRNQLCDCPALPRTARSRCNGGHKKATTLSPFTFLCPLKPGPSPPFFATAVVPPPEPPPWYRSRGTATVVPPPNDRGVQLISVLTTEIDVSQWHVACLHAGQNNRQET
jgi:hypothetical protein